MKKVLLFIVIAAIVLALAIGISYKVAYNNATKDKEESTETAQKVENKTEKETYGKTENDSVVYHIDGTYVSESSYETESLTYVFDGDTVYFGGLSEQEGTYKVESDKIVINYTKSYDPEGEETDEFPYGKTEEVDIIDDDTLESRVEGIATTFKRDMSTVADGIVLYYGFDITGYKPDKMYWVGDMDYTTKNKEKYEIDYYTYKQGKYLGKSHGEFVETYQDVGAVDIDGTLCFSRNYNPFPRDTKTRSLPTELKDAYKVYTNTSVLSSDLDNDGKEELLVVYQKNIKAEDADDGEPISESGIDLYDSNHKKIATLVEDKDGFWLSDKNEDQRFSFDLDDIEISDIDADGNMEVLVRIPAWEALGLCIYKYENGKIKGEIDYNPILAP